MIYLQLLLSFMLIGLFTIGGGYASLPLIQQQAVYTNGWLTIWEFSELIAIAEATPGPIALNAATYVGVKAAGIPGAVFATLGFLIPPFIIISIFYYIYKKYRKLSVMKGVLNGVRPASIALIASAGATILILALWGEGGLSLAATNLTQLVFFALSLALLRKFRPNPVLVILGCGAASAALEMLLTAP